MSEESLSNVQRKMEDTSPSDSRGRGGETAEEEGGGNEIISSQLRSLISDELSAFIVEQEGVDILTEYVCHMMQDGEISEAHIRAELDEFLDDKTDAFASWLTLNIVPKLPKSEPRQPQTRKWTGTNNNESTQPSVSASGNTAGDRPASSHFGETCAAESGSTSSPESLKRGRTADTGGSSGGSGGVSSPRPWYEDGSNNPYGGAKSGGGGGDGSISRDLSPPSPSTAHGGAHIDTDEVNADASAVDDTDHSNSGNRRRAKSPPPKRPGDKRSGVFKQALKGLSENRHEHKLYGQRNPDGPPGSQQHYHRYGPHHTPMPHGSSSLGSSSKGRRRFEMIAEREDGDMQHYDRYRGRGAGGSPWSVPAEWRGELRGGDFRYTSRSRSREAGVRRSLCMPGRHMSAAGRIEEGHVHLAGDPLHVYHSSSGGQFGGGHMLNAHPYPQAAQQNNSAACMNNNSMHHIHRDSNMSERAGGISDSTNSASGNNSSFPPSFPPRGTQPSWGSPPGMQRNYREPRSRMLLRADNSKIPRTQGHYRDNHTAAGADHHVASAPISPTNYRRAGSADAPPPPHSEMIPHGVVPPPYPLAPRVADGLGPNQPPYIVGDAVADVVMGDHRPGVHGGDIMTPGMQFSRAAGPPSALDANGMHRVAQQPPQQPGGAAGKIKKRCANFPSCRFGDTCRYIHPSEMCKTWPHCQYGVECFYIHPEVDCKFGVNCYNWYCNYRHPPEWSPSFPGANYGGGINPRMPSMISTGANKFGTSNRFQVFKNRTLRETDFEESSMSTSGDGAATKSLTAPAAESGIIAELPKEANCLAVNNGVNAV